MTAGSPNTPDSFEEQFRVLDDNVTKAARYWQIFTLLNDRIYRDEVANKAVNHDARFWVDYNDMALRTTVILLGTIFDTQPRAHNIWTCIEAMKADLSRFSRAALKQRKLQTGGTFDVDSYVADAHELTVTDVDLIIAEAKKAEALWKGKIGDLRHQVFAHNQKLTKEQRLKLFHKVAYDDISKSVQILINVVSAIQQAEWNGRRPDFAESDLGSAQRAQAVVDGIIDVIIKGTQKPKSS